MRALGLFNLIYGSLGLLSAAILAAVHPVLSPPAPVLAAGAVASAWTAAVGIAIMVRGPAAATAARRALARATGRRRR